ncbi:hypothetical protein JHU04_004320 [Brenneria sp. 4F2]|nr:hypothetical protein [Brenneria bubanii]
MIDKSNFIKDKMEKIHIALINNQSDLYKPLGEVNDLFYSPYKRDVIVDNKTIQSLWIFLFEMFILSDDNHIKFDIISAIYDMYIYHENIDIHLSLDSIRCWRARLKKEDLSPEIIECIDDMLSI